LFLPYALNDYAAYIACVQKRFAQMGFKVESPQAGRNLIAYVSRAKAVFVGGGNTFLLLYHLHRLGLLDAIRHRVLLSGVPYIGASAGANVACATIKTSNDMAIVQPRNLKGMGLVPFNINPHFVDGAVVPDHMGETREARIEEFHEHNSEIVVGLREGSMLRIEGSKVRLRGVSGAKIFVKGQEPREYKQGSELDWLLTPRDKVKHRTAGAED
jgi:dipeptidase E